MSVLPVEPQSWGDDQTPGQDPEDVARTLHEQLVAAKQRMRAYRDEMEACGLTQTPELDKADPSG